MSDAGREVTADAGAEAADAGSPAPAPDRGRSAARDGRASTAAAASVSPDLSPATGPPDGRATRFGGTLATVVATATALLVGVAGGPGVGAVAAVAGGLVVAGGVAWVNGADNLRRALGSVGLVAGTGALAVALGLASSTPAVGLTALVGVGVAAAALSTLVRPRYDLAPAALRATGRSLVPILPAAILALLVHNGVLRRAGAAALGAVTASAGDLTLFVGVQILAVVAAVLAGRALPAIESWAPDRYAPDAPSLAPSRDVRRAVAAVLGVQVLAAWVGVGGPAFARVLTATGVAGAAVRTALRSLVVHGALAALAALFAVVVVADAVRDPLLARAEATPPREVALTGGGAAALVGVAALGVPPVGTAAAAFATRVGFGPTVAAVGVGATLLGGTAGLLVAIGVGTAVVTRLGGASTRFLPTRGAGFAVAAAALVAAAVVAAETGAPALAVVPGVAGALAVWGVGAVATTLGAVIGREGTAEVESVNAAGTLVAGAVGVGVALAAAYLLGPVGGLTGSRALLALVLVTVALAAFALVGARG